MFRVKKEYLNRRIVKGNEEFILSDDLSQKKLIYIKRMISGHYIEEYEEDVQSDGEVSLEPIKKRKESLKND